MANPEQIAVLKRGSKAWNDWRLGNPGTTPNLRAGNFAGVDLAGAQLFSAHLGEANLHGAKLVGANLRGAYLRGADLSEADLCQANLREADISRVNLSEAVLTEAAVNATRVGLTIFANNDLSQVGGLDAVQHLGPLTIGIDTIYKSKGNIPDVFLRGCGVPEEFIVYKRSLVENPIDFYSCFISYSSKDGALAQRLYDDLQAKKFDENAKWGEPVWGEIDTAIRYYDKLVVICSTNSLQSPPVTREIERALQKEEREHKNGSSASSSGNLFARVGAHRLVVNGFYADLNHVLGHWQRRFCTPQVRSHLVVKRTR
jgi:hypothetical protein